MRARALRRHAGRAGAIAWLCGGLASPVQALPQTADRTVPHRLVVSPHGPFTSVAGAIAAGEPGDTVHVEAGTYEGPLLIERPLSIIGRGGPVIRGSGRGHIIEALAPVHVEGLVLRGSGDRIDTEDAGIMVRAGPARIIGNTLDDVLFGIYLKEAAGSEVRGNRVRGKPLALSRRGDGIRLWQSPASSVTGNRVERTRDVVVYFSSRLAVRDNVITDGRYGLHYMYSHDNRVSGNRFERNDVGAFIMYSSGLVLERNVFAESRGASGIGLGLKDADDIVARDNLLVGNGAGVHLDNSPSAAATPNRLAGNTLLMNDVGIRMLPSVRGNEISGNTFRGNLRPAEVAGGTAAGQAAQNLWTGNYWSSYAGFDEDGDGRGDTPFVHARLADELLSRHAGLRLFEGSPALRLLDLLAHFFPLLEPVPVVSDASPRLDPGAGGIADDFEAALDSAPGASARGVAWAAAAWAALFACACAASAGLGRRLTPS